MVSEDQVVENLVGFLFSILIVSAQLICLITLGTESLCTAIYNIGAM